MTGMVALTDGQLVYRNRWMMALSLLPSVLVPWAMADAPWPLLVVAGALAGWTASQIMWQSNPRRRLRQVAIGVCDDYLRLDDVNGSVAILFGGCG